MEQLIQEVQQLSRKETTYVEKIEYKFDQLKVETVEGTLHIGVLPGGQHAQSVTNGMGQGEAQAEGMMQESGFTGGPYDLQFSARAQTELFTKAKQRVDQYVKHDLPEYIQLLQHEHSRLLGEQYVSQMVHDIHMQCEGRILYYLNQMNLSQNTQAAEDEVVERTMRDIEHAIKQHIETIA